MYFSSYLRLACWIAVEVAFVANAMGAPVVPKDDQEVVEHLPTRLIGMPRLNQATAAVTAGVPTGKAAAMLADVAASRATTLLGQARDRGDPRYAGYALAAIAPWRNDPAPPIRVAIVSATIAQYQHDFDRSRRTLEAVLKRDPSNAQATLTLATIARVQGRYADSDNLCRMVPVAIYRSACLAENLGLRGETDRGRQAVEELLASPETQGPGSASLRQWLTTTLAELEERAGHERAADDAYREALAFGRDSYLTLDYVDFLIAHRRAAEAERLLALEPQPYGDGVLLRQAIAQKQANDPIAAASTRELADRFDAARERGDAVSIHGRELARSLYAVQDDPKAAVVVARANLLIQKEPADFLVMAEAARASGDRDAAREVAALAASVGMVDHRLEAILAGWP